MVHVASLAGETIHTVFIPSGSTIWAQTLKGWLRERYGWPVLLQHLFLDGAELEEGDVISGSHTNVTLIIEASKILHVLSVDHATEVVGRYFNIEGLQLGLFGECMVCCRVTNKRTGITGLVKIWGWMNGGSRGTAHGRFEPMQNSWAGQFEIGDELIFVSPLDVIVVKGVNEPEEGMEAGEYFYFDAGNIGLGVGASQILVIINEQTGVIRPVIVWETGRCGSGVMAAGRYYPRAVSERFAIGQVLLVVPHLGAMNVTGVDYHGEPAGKVCSFARVNLAEDDYVVCNFRDGWIGLVNVWFSPDPMFQEIAYGRYVYGPDEGNFELRDELYILPMRESLFVTSVDHAHGEDGEYFNFERGDIRLGENMTARFVVVNMRDGWVGQVVVWGYSNGGRTGDAHGRYYPFHAGGQFREGDVLRRLA